MADSPFDDVTIKYPPTDETRVVTRGSVRGFTNRGWVVLDASGRVNSKAKSSGAPTKKAPAKRTSASPKSPAAPAADAPVKEN